MLGPKSHDSGEWVGMDLGVNGSPQPKIARDMKNQVLSMMFSCPTKFVCKATPRLSYKKLPMILIICYRKYNFLSNQ